MPTSPLAELKNYQKWNHFCEPLPSPQRFIDAGWLFMIGAALQRRVWMGTELMATYPNSYNLLVAEPGVGKSLVTSAIKKVFMRQAMGVGGTTAKAAPKLLYPISADSTSFESFVNFAAESTQAVTKPPTPPAPDEKPKLDRYFHSSPIFILDEAASIFDKDAGKMATFLLEGWTCTDRYVRRTIGRGEDAIDNICINLIGGIQPGKLVELSRIAILDNGFSRRCIIVYGEKNRFRTDHIEHNESQIKAFNDIVTHVRTLHKLFGEVKITPEAREWMRQVFVIDEPIILNRSEYLKYYYPTKTVHVKKLAMAMHFSESTTMEVGLDSFRRAYEFLTALECDMHMAYVGSRDERGTLLNRIRHMLLSDQSGHGMSCDEMYPDLVDIVNYDDLLPALRDLVKAGNLLQTKGGNYVINRS